METQEAHPAGCAHGRHRDVGVHPGEDPAGGHRRRGRPEEGAAPRRRHPVAAGQELDLRAHGPRLPTPPRAHLLPALAGRVAAQQGHTAGATPAAAGELPSAELALPGAVFGTAGGGVGPLSGGELPARGPRRGASAQAASFPEAWGGGLAVRRPCQGELRRRVHGRHREPAAEAVLHPGFQEHLLGARARLDAEHPRGQRPALAALGAEALLGL
mmetsp:Transcript_47227/g.137398  ORF Transcript_47227/g.137398 Transcript_47227/m.137398 type:complete len:215 (+) Transcript_47227:1086-1730(+)